MAETQQKTNASVAADLKELKSQMGSVIETLNEREPGKFPSVTKNPRIEQTKVIQLRSGKQIARTSKAGEAEVHSNPKSSIDLTNGLVMDMDRTAEKAVEATDEGVTQAVKEAEKPKEK